MKDESMERQLNRVEIERLRHKIQEQNAEIQRLNGLMGMHRFIEEMDKKRVTDLEADVLKSIATLEATVLRLRLRIGTPDV